MPIKPYDGYTVASTSGAVSSVNGKSGSVTIGKSDVGLGNCSNTSDADKPVSTAQKTAIDAVTSATDTKLLSYVLTSKVGIASGVASLDATGVLASAQIPSSLLAGLKWKGVWNASTNSPTLSSTPSANGDFYRVSIAGTSSAPTGSAVSYGVGDWLISNGTSWQYVVNTLNDATSSTKGVVQLAGDLSGGAASVTVAKLNGITAPATAPTAARQMMMSSSTSALQYGALTEADIPVATSVAKGAIKLAGDISGTADAPKVNGIDGYSIQNDPTGASQVLVVSDFANKQLQWQAQTGGGGVSASYMFATAATGQTISANNSIIAFANTTAVGSDISLSSNCFLLKAGKTYFLRGSVGGVNFTTTANSYAYAQWRTGQTGGAGTLLGTSADMEASALSTQNQRSVPYAEAIYTPSSDTYVHFEATTNGTVCSIGQGAITYAWIEVLSGSAPITGQSTSVYSVSASATQSTSAANTIVTFDSATSQVVGTNISQAASCFLLKGGSTYELRASLGQVTFSTVGYTRFQWRTGQTGGSGTLLGNLAEADSASYAGNNISVNTEATAIYTPVVDTYVHLELVATNNLSSISSGQYAWAVIKQLGTSSVTDMVGATGSMAGVRGTVPAPAAGKQSAHLRGDGTWDNMSWTSYTPTITGSTTNPTLATTKTLAARYKVVGKTLELSFTYYAASNTGAAAGSGAYLFSLPSGFTIDTTVASIVSTPTSVTGDFSGVVASALGSGVSGHNMSPSGSASVYVVGTSTTTVGLFIGFSSSGTVYNTLVGSSINQITNTGCYYKFTASVPIV